jgi:hypothetical protein
MTNHNSLQPGLRPRWSERLYWAIVLLWAGLAIAADGLDALPTLGHADVWNWIFLGAGLLALGRIILQAVSPTATDGPTAPGHAVSDLGYAVVVTVLGLGGFFSFWIVCSLALVAVGTMLLIQSLHRSGTPAQHPAG